MNLSDAISIKCHASIMKTSSSMKDDYYRSNVHADTAEPSTSTQPTTPTWQTKMSHPPMLLHYPMMSQQMLLSQPPMLSDQNLLLHPPMIFQSMMLSHDAFMAHPPVLSRPPMPSQQPILLWPLMPSQQALLSGPQMPSQHTILSRPPMPPQQPLLAQLVAILLTEQPHQESTGIPSALVSTSTTQTDVGACNTDGDDATAGWAADETHEAEQTNCDEQESALVPPEPPRVGLEFVTFEQARDYYQVYARFNGFSICIDHRRELLDGTYNRGALVGTRGGKNSNTENNADKGIPVIQERKR
jgi:hypothetical protein